VFPALTWGEARQLKLAKERKVIMLLMILGFGVGVFVAYKYPQQVEQGIQTGKKLFNDLKDMIFKKETPS
jgi:hypothetical protein